MPSLPTTTPEVEELSGGPAPVGPDRRRRLRILAHTLFDRWARLAADIDRWLSRPRNAVLALTALFAVVAMYHAAHSTQLRGFVLMTDELQYLKLALNIPHNVVPELHGRYFASYNQLYPLLIAPLGAAIESVPSLFVAIHTMNPFLMASVVVPTYLLTRELVDSRFAAVVAAAIAVAGPWLVYTSVIMTENVAYPAFVWAMLGMQRALAVPSLRRDVVALGGIALAASARTQFAALLPVFVVAIFLERANHETATSDRMHEDEGFARGLRIAAVEHRPLLLVAAAIAALAAVLTVVLSPDSVVGIYGTVFEKPLVPNGLISHMVEHAATITVGYGVLPVVLALAFAASVMRRAASRTHRSFAWLLVLATITVLFISSSFNVNFSLSGLNDRYVFYVLPLIAVAAVVALVDRHVSWQSIAASGLAVAALIPFAHLDGYPESFWTGAPSSALDPVLNGKLWEVNRRLPVDFSLELVLVFGALLATAAAVVLVRRRRGPVALATVALPVLIWLVVETRYQYDSQGGWSRPTPSVVSKALRSSSIGEVDWIDKRLSSGSVALMPAATVGQGGWWLDEFFNRRVDKLFRYHNPSQPARYSTSLVHYQLETLFHDQLKVERRSGRVFGMPVSRMTPHVVVAASEARFGFAGERELAEAPEAAPSERRRLLRVDVPYRAGWIVDNVLDDNWTVGDETSLHLFPRSRKPEVWRVALHFFAPPEVGRPRSWSIESREARRVGRLRLKQETTVHLSPCVRPGPRPARLDLRTRGKTTLPDGRSVGLVLVSIRATPTGSDCGGKQNL